MWLVRRTGERDFGQGFHLVDCDEAFRLRDYLNGKDQEFANYKQTAFCREASLKKDRDYALDPDWRHRWEVVMREENNRLRAVIYDLTKQAAPEVLAALRDMLAGWQYIRKVHGDLPGVGWDRAENAAIAAIAKVEGSE
jgi:hypothetical protein